MTSKKLSDSAGFQALHEICARYQQPNNTPDARVTVLTRNHSAAINRMTICRANGFTMIEVLVSVFVLAVGVIGAAGMQLTALRTAQQSTFQTIALQLASETADKMRINYRQMKLADNANLFLNVDYKSAADTPVTAPRVMCYQSDCNDEELAKFDIYELKTRVKALPGGRVRICRDATPWDNAAGAFQWACSAPEASGNNAPLVIKIGWDGKGRSPDGRTKKDAGLSTPPGVAITLASYSQ